MGTQQEMKLQVGLETNNAVITLEKDVEKLYSNFKMVTEALLKAEGFLCEWSDSASEECDVVIRIVQLDQGNKSLRSFLSWIPLTNMVICLFPATFEIEMTVSESSLQKKDFHYIETHRNAVADALTMLDVCAARLAKKIVKEIVAIRK